MAVADMLAALRIKANIIADRSVGLMDIFVDVHDGLAVLTGEVETEEQKQIAEELASQVDGVLEIENEINVVPAQRGEQEDANLGYGMAEGDIGDTAFSVSGASQTPGPGFPTSEQFPGEFTDEEIQRHVMHRLRSQGEVDASDIQVHVENQVAHLSGSVATPEDLNALQDVVTNARGVMGVESQVRVRRGTVGTEAD